MVLIDDNSTTLALGDAMPHFVLPVTDGSTLDSNVIKSSVLAVIFTCNHCPYAQAYEDRLVAMAEKFKDAGVQFVLISSNDATDYPEDSFKAMQKKVAEKGYKFPYCYDESQEVAHSFGALCTPHCFVFNQERNLMYKGRIDDSWRDASAVQDASLQNAITDLVAGNDPTNPEVNAIGCSIKWK
jgi:peroxiredoxin